MLYRFEQRTYDIFSHGVKNYSPHSKQPSVVQHSLIQIVNNRQYPKKTEVNISTKILEVGICLQAIS